MQKIIIALAVAFLTAGPLLASEGGNVMATVNQFTNAFNKGDIKAAAAACAEQMSIIDDFPPHEWHGKGAFSRWVKDYEAFGKKNGLTDALAKLGKPRHVDVTGDRAYVVVPVNFTYKQNGKPMKQTGSLVTWALHKTRAGWRITGWAWSKH